MKHVTKQRALESINISEVTFNKKEAHYGNIWSR